MVVSSIIFRCKSIFFTCRTRILIDLRLHEMLEDATAVNSAPAPAEMLAEVVIRADVPRSHVNRNIVAVF